MTTVTTDTTTVVTQSSLARYWYGNSEDSLLRATGRSLSKFILGGLFGGMTWTFVKKLIDDQKDPSGVKRVKQAQAKAQVIAAKRANDIADASNDQLLPNTQQEYTL